MIRAFIRRLFRPAPLLVDLPSRVLVRKLELFEPTPEETEHILAQIELENARWFAAHLGQSLRGRTGPRAFIRPEA